MSAVENRQQGRAVDPDAPGPLELLVVQPTPFCNINCSYCYLPDRQSTRRITPETLERVFRWIFASGLVRRPFTLLWHAGEPLVLPVGFYESAAEMLRRHNTAEVPVIQSFQTNATLIDPAMVARLSATDPQMILPTLVLEKAPLIAQIMFFGALLSAIKSCASATLLAPSVTFTENIVKPLMGKMSDRKLLLAMRIVTLIFTVLVTLYAINSEASIFKMVENAYQITLVTAFVPLAFGVYWRRATNQGAILSMFLGLAVWLAIHLFGPEDPFMPAQFAGLLAALFGMIAGSLLPQVVHHDTGIHDALRHGHHHAAAQTHHAAGVHHHGQPAHEPKS